MVTSEDALLDQILQLIAKDAMYFSLLEFPWFEYLSIEPIKSVAAMISGSFDLVTLGIWDRIVKRLVLAVTPPKTDQRWFSQRLDSNIISTFPRNFRAFKGRKFRLLYRGTRDGFQARQFYQLCGGHKDTVTVISSMNNCTFGGYTPAEWSGTKGQFATDGEGNSFLFTIKNPHNIPPRIFPLKPHRGTTAIMINPEFGPTFGKDLFVSDQCDQTNKNFTNLGQFYENNSQLPGDVILTGERYYRVQEIEVFQMTE
jgi:hypothetical protein